MIVALINKIPSKQVRIFLKENVFRKYLHRHLAEKVSIDSVRLVAERTMSASSLSGRSPEQIDKIIEYKREALRHFQFISTPTEFQKGVVYPLLVKIGIFVGGFLAGAMTQYFGFFSQYFRSI